MRRVLLAAAILASAIGARAVEIYPAGWTPVPVNEFGGLNLLSDSTAIGNDAQKAQNVLTDNGYLEKRPGNVILGTILAGYPVKYVTDWVAPSGTRYLIAHASDTIYQTDFSAAPVALSTAQPLFYINAVPAFGRLIVADGYRPPWYWNGTSTATVVSANGTAAPICTYMAFKDSRIYCANIPNEGTSRVRISSTGGMGYWVVPPDVAQVDNAPNVFDFTPDDGDSIKCMATTPWGVFVGKQYSSWMIKGTGNLSYDLRILDPKVGCKDNRSVQMVYGVLHWLSNDGVYAHDGSGPPRLISRELDPLVANLPYTAYGSKFWLNDVQADWQTGNLTASGPGAPISATITNGSITPSSVTLTDNTSALFNLGVCEGCGANQDGDLQVAGVSSTYTIKTDVIGSAGVGNDYYASIAPSLWTRSAGGTLGTSYSASTQTITFNNAFALYTKTFTANPNGPTQFTFRGRFGDYGGGFTKADDHCSIYLGVTANGSPENSASRVEITKDNISYGEFATQAGYMATEANPGTTSTFTIISSTWGASSFWRNGVFITSGTRTTNVNPTTAVIYCQTPSAGNFVYYLGFSYVSTMTVNPGISNIVSVATATSRIFDTGVSTPTFGLLTVSSLPVAGTVLSNSVRTSTSPNNDMWGAYASVADISQPPSGGSRYAQYRSTFSQLNLVESPGITSVVLPAATTGYFNSAVHLIGSAISAYGIFTVSESLPNGATTTYQVRATTYSFTDASGINIPWTAQTANQTPTIAVSTPTYFQFRSKLDFNRAENAPTISRIQTNWNEGTGLPVSSGVLDRRYHLCVTISATSTSPDTCLIKQKTGKWVTWTGPSIGAMGIYNYTLIAADGGTSSKVWTIMVPGAYSDDGTAIDSQWVSADYTNGLIFNNKILHEFWVDATPVATSSVTMSYAVNKSSAYTDYQFYLDNGGALSTTLLPAGKVQYGSINQLVPLLSGFDQAKYMRIKFSDAILNNYWRINSFLLYLENQGRQLPY